MAKLVSLSTTQRMVSTSIVTSLSYTPPILSFLSDMSEILWKSGPW